jgi:hypothetical protein
MRSGALPCVADPRLFFLVDEVPTGEVEGQSIANRGSWSRFQRVTPALNSRSLALRSSWANASNRTYSRKKRESSPCICFTLAAACFCWNTSSSISCCADFREAVSALSAGSLIRARE